MNWLNPSEDGFMSTERFMQWLQRLEEQLEAPHAPVLCTMCTGSGLCLTCRGHGHIVVHGRGRCNCTVCIGDGACIRCEGTGQVLHA